MRVGVILLLLLPPGLGHIVIRRYSKGITLWLIFMFCTLGILLAYFLSPESTAVKASVVAILSLALLISWGYSIYDIIAICGVFRNRVSQEEKDSYFHQGVRHYLRNELDEAAANFKHILDLDKRDVEALFQLAMVYKSKGDLKRSIATFKRCHALDSDEKWYYEIEKEMEGLSEAIKVNSNKYDKRNNSC